MAKKKHQQKKQSWPYKLTLSPCGTRWIKKYKQKQHYHPIPEEIRGNTKKLETHNRKVWKEWWLPLIGKLKATEVKQDKEEIRDRWNLHIERLTGRLYGIARLDSREMFLNELIGTYIYEYEVQTGQALSKEERRAIYDAPQQHLEVFGYVPREDNPELYTLPAERRSQADAVDSDTTIEALIVRFLVEKKGEVTSQRLAMLKSTLLYLQQFLGGGTEFSHVTEQTLKDYRLHVLQLMDAGKFGDERAAGLLAIAKQFIRWCMGQSKLVSELDPIVASSIHAILSARGALSVKVSRKAVKTSELQEIRGFLGNDQKSEMVELYALLAANCAMTPADIVDFRWDQMENGILTYKRHKERDRDRVPVVKYPLWQRTFELLEKMPKTDERVFPKTAGAVDDAMRNAREKTEFSDTLGTIKKTSSTMIGEEYNNDLADYWLGHAPNGVGQRHYIAPSDEALAKAVTWLETQYFPEEPKNEGEANS